MNWNCFLQKEERSLYLKKTPTATILIFNPRNWCIVEHIPRGDENGAHVSFGFDQNYLGWHKLWILFPCCWECGKTSPGWLEPMDLTVSEHEFCSEHMPGSDTIFPPCPREWDHSRISHCKLSQLTKLNWFSFTFDTEGDLCSSRIKCYICSPNSHTFCPNVAIKNSGLAIRLFLE